MCRRDGFFADMFIMLWEVGMACSSTTKPPLHNAEIIVTVDDRIAKAQTVPNWSLGYGLTKDAFLVSLYEFLDVDGFVTLEMIDLRSIVVDGRERRPYSLMVRNKLFL